jgi:streptogramin lyase
MGFSAIVVAAVFLMPVDEAGAALELYVGSFTGNSVLELNSSGVPSTFIPSVGEPAGIAFDSSGDCYVASQLIGHIGPQTNSIYEYSPTGALLKTFATGGLLGVEALAFNSAGDLYVANSNDSDVLEYSPAGALVHSFGIGLVTSTPVGVVVDSRGDVFVSDPTFESIYEFSPSGTLIRTLQGTTGIGNGPAQMVLDSSGNLYVTNDLSGAIEEFSPAGTLLGTFAQGASPGTYGLAYDPATGIFFQSNYNNGTIQEFSSTGASLGFLATGLTHPYLLAISPAAVPEPSSLALMAVGLAAAAGRARHRKRRATA